MSLRLSEEDYARLLEKRGMPKSNGAAVRVKAPKSDVYRLEDFANEAIAIGCLKCPASPLLVTLKTGVKALGRSDGKRKPFERIEQAITLLWLEWRSPVAFEMTTATPMGGYRPDGSGGQLRGEGAKAGIPDLYMDIPRNGYHGLRIEMKKSDRSAQPSDDQKGWLQRLADHGYKAVLCRGHQAAIKTISLYLGIDTDIPALPEWAITEYAKSSHVHTSFN